jgi:hypothetical protein
LGLRSGLGKDRDRSGLRTGVVRTSVWFALHPLFGSTTAPSTRCLDRPRQQFIYQSPAETLSSGSSPSRPCVAAGGNPNSAAAAASLPTSLSLSSRRHPRARPVKAWLLPAAAGTAGPLAC